MQVKKFLQMMGLSATMFILAACSSTGTGATANNGNSGDLTGSGVQTAGLGMDGSNSLSNPNAMVPGANQKYYFDFDQSTVHSSDMPSIKVQSQYLISHPSASVLLEGNTDTMGSREYNVALGQRRADAVSSILKLQGVSPKQIRTLSYGSEKPQITQCSSSDPSICAVDRRDDMIYQTH